MTCQAEIGYHVQATKFEKDSMQVLKLLGTPLRGFTVQEI